MESPKDETCPVPTSTNLNSLSLKNTPNTPHVDVDERFRRRAISGLLCFFVVGWVDASGYTLPFCFLRLIDDFSNWGGSPLYPRGILS
jgi:hypothetical protein